MAKWMSHAAASIIANSLHRLTPRRRDGSLTCAAVVAGAKVNLIATLWHTISRGLVDTLVQFEDRVRCR